MGSKISISRIWRFLLGVLPRSYSYFERMVGVCVYIYTYIYMYIEFHRKAGECRYLVSNMAGQGVRLRV